MDDIILNTIISTLDTFLIISRDAKIRNISYNTCKMLGYSVDELRGRSFDEIVVLDDFLSKEEWVNYMIEIGGNKKSEMTLRTKEGGEAPVIFSSSAIHNNEGNPEGLLCIAYDISDRKHFENELNKAQKYTQNIIESSMDMIVAVNTDGRVTEFNRAAQRVFDYALEEVLERESDLLFEKSDTLEEMKDIIQRDGKFSGEINGIDKKGRSFPMLVSASSLYNEDGDLIGHMKILRDITKQKMADKTLRMLKMAVETMQIGITIADLSGIIMYSNTADAKMHGFDSVDILIGKEVRVFSQQKLWNPMSLEQLKQLNSWRRESTNVRQNGKVFPVQLMSNLVYDEKSTPFAVVTSCEDITERKRLEEELIKHRDHLEELVDQRTCELQRINEELLKAKEAAEEASQVKSNFLTTVSHELRTPLTSILGFTVVMQKDLASVRLINMDNAPKKALRGIRNLGESIEIIKNESERLTALINNVLDLSKIEAGKVEWEEEDVDIREVFQSALNSLSSLFEQKGLEIHSDVGEGDFTLIGDKNRLIQVVTNLLGNAIKFTDYGTIAYRLRASQNFLRCEVEDQGIGIPQDKLDKVFEKFLQIGDIIKNKPAGTGLGLPICKEIVEQHKGRIWAESVEGMGSKFIIEFPVKDNV